jgi:hypothetical protein
MLIQEVYTDLAPQEVVDRARVFFTTRFTPYAGFASDESESHIRFRFEAGVLTVGAVAHNGRTLVRGSTSRLNHELSQFLSTLSRPEAVRQSLPGPAVSGAG